MNTKVIAVAVIAVIVVAAVGVYFFTDDEDDYDRTLAAVARVNTDGSGIYLKAEYDPAELIEIDADGNIKYLASGWGGKVFGTPGLATIQHVQLKGIVEEMGLKWEKFDKEKNPDTVYYVETVNNYSAATEKSGALIDGGILWEPQYTKIAMDPMYQPLILTNDMFPGHTCCVIAASQEFLTANPDAAVAYLAAYMKAVNYINLALEDTTSAEYTNLVSICVKYTSGLTEEEIKAALENVVFKFSDDNKTGSLANLVDDIASLETDLYDGGIITVDIADLGFKDSNEFAKALVDDSYLRDAADGKAVKVDNVKITVAAITGDIHQIGVRVAEDLGYFEEYGLSVTVNGFGSGPLVAQDIINGHSDFAFLGAPPLTINVVNGEEITATA